MNANGDLDAFARVYRARPARPQSAGPSSAPAEPLRQGPRRKRRLERYRLLARLEAAKSRIAELEAEVEDLRGQKRADWLSLALEVQRLLLARPQAGKVSVIALAAALGVHERLVFKWLHGQCRPTSEMRKRMADWLAQREGEI